MSKKKRAFSPQFERDYTFYLLNKDKFTFAGTDIQRDYGIQFPEEPEIIPFSIPYSSEGKSAKVCFFQLDSEGKCKPCAEPELLVKIISCKAAVNLQIKIWAQSRAEYTLSKIELEEYMAFYQAPEWVLKAVENQKLKILKDWALQKLYKSAPYLETFKFHMAEALQEIAAETPSADVILDLDKPNLQEQK